LLKKLNDIIQERKRNMPADSYTVELLQAGEDKVLKKVGEEAMEVILAAKGQGPKRLVEETADLFYHVLVLLAAYDLSLEDVEEELRKRHGGAPAQLPAQRE